jgi:hypothetical protein
MKLRDTFIGGAIKLATHQMDREFTTRLSNKPASAWREQTQRTPLMPQSEL